MFDYYKTQYIVNNLILRRIMHVSNTIQVRQFDVGWLIQWR